VFDYQTRQCQKFKTTDHAFRETDDMNIDEVMALNEEDLMIMVAEIQGLNNLEWMPKPFDKPGRMFIDKDKGQPILNPVENIVASWNLWIEMNHNDPYQWVLFGDSEN